MRRFHRSDASCRSSNWVMSSTPFEPRSWRRWRLPSPGPSVKVCGCLRVEEKSRHFWSNFNFRCNLAGDIFPTFSNFYVFSNFSFRDLSR